MALKPHPLRSQIVREMHLRPSLAIAPPARIFQIVVFVPDQVFGAIRRYAAEIGFKLEDGARDARLERDGVIWLWEQHAEAVTISLLIPGPDHQGHGAEVDRLENVPGTVIRAIRVDLFADAEAAEVRISELGLDGDDGVGGISGGVRFQSDFRLSSDDGYGRLVIVAPPAQSVAKLGRVVQSLQELGNYRNLALLGLPLVREASAELLQAESAIGSIAEEIAKGGDDRAQLERLLALSAEIARLRSRTAFQLSATTAYARIVWDRLEGLAAEPVTGLQSLAEFTNRRFAPAMRTCENFSERLDKLALKVEQATGLLRARIETSLQVQNSELLHGLNETAARQLRLQHLVEGLSVFAVSYYALGLLGYVLEGLTSIVPFDTHRVQGLLAVPVAIVIVAFLRHQQRRSK